MKPTLVSEWVNLIASVGVIVGLVLVAYELRQNNEIAQAESYRTLWEMVSELQTMVVETDIGTIWQKSFEDPAALTDDELIKLHAYLALALEIQIVKAVMHEEYKLYPVSTEVQADDIVGSLLQGEFAREWYDRNEPWIGRFQPELAEAIRKRLAEVPVQHSWSTLEQMRSITVDVSN